MLYLPTPCLECQELTMEVIHVGPNDEYEAKCTVCGTRRSGMLKAQGSRWRSTIADGDT